MHVSFSHRRATSRRTKSAALFLVATFALVMVGAAQADTTNPAQVNVPANQSRTATGQFNDPLEHLVPEATCPTQQADPGQLVPNCVHTIFRPVLGAGGTSTATVRATYDPNQALVDVTVRTPDGVLISQGLAESCGPGCAEAGPFAVASGDMFDVTFSPAVFTQMVTDR